MQDVPIRNASTLIVTRENPLGLSVLMGQRGAAAVFMPGKFVFPGGAVDPVDAEVPVELSEPCASRLEQDSDVPPSALAAAAIRELWEETGLILGRPGAWGDPPQGWHGFAESGHVPDARSLRFVFRAITPPGRPRRFDARFFLAQASALQTDPDDFSRAEDELSHLQWVPLSAAREFDLPFITQVVLAEIAAGLGRDGPPEDVPFVRNDDEKNIIKRLGRVHPLDGVEQLSTRGQNLSD